MKRALRRREVAEPSGKSSQNFWRAPLCRRPASHKATFDEMAIGAILGMSWGKAASPRFFKESLFYKCRVGFGP